VASSRREILSDASTNASEMIQRDSLKRVQFMSALGIRESGHLFKEKSAEDRYEREQTWCSPWTCSRR
jgi:hypothetical protein